MEIDLANDFVLSHNIITLKVQQWIIEVFLQTYYP